MDHVHYVHYVRGSSGMGARGGWHGGSSAQMWSGMSHGGGGGMHR
jgi:hypothetical protein